jgi:hypothetical protein
VLAPETGPADGLTARGDIMRSTAGRVALGLGALNLATLILMAAVSADDGFWGIGNKTLPLGALPVSAIARGIEETGITHIYAIDAGRNVYEVKALDPAGKRVRLTVDPLTGAILARAVS